MRHRLRAALVLVALSLSASWPVGCAHDEPCSTAPFDVDATGAITHVAPFCDEQAAIALEVTVQRPAADVVIARVDGRPLFAWDAHLDADTQRLCLTQEEVRGASDVSLSLANVRRDQPVEGSIVSARFVEEPACASLTSTTAQTAPLAIVDGNALAWSVAPPFGTQVSEIVDGVAHLVDKGRCDRASAASPELGGVVVPDDDGAALAFTARGHLGDDLDGRAESVRVIVAGELVAELTTLTPEDVDSSFCLPPSLRGTVARLSFELVGPGGTCATPYGQEAFISEVRAVHDDRCAGAAVTDGAFVRDDLTWMLHDSTRDDDDRAHLAVHLHNMTSFAATIASAPADGHARLSFHYSYRDAPTSRLALFLPTGETALAPAADDVAFSACVAGVVNEPVYIIVQLQDENGPDDVISAEAFIDDVALHSDPLACP